jgi:hypothetical protein
MSRERRRHTRWKMDEDIHCYVDGDRMDLRSSDMSSGGMLLTTDVLIQPGVQIALVFRGQVQDGGKPIFLLARVMRRQVLPTEGVGLRWERAVTEGPPAELIAFLRTRLRLLSPEVQVKPMKRRPGETQACYVFTEATASVLPPATPGAAGVAKRVAGPRRKSSAPGPFTDQVRTVNALAPTDIEAVFVMDGMKEPARVDGLGPNVMSLVAELLGPRKGTDVKVIFEIKGKKGPAEVICDCSIRRVELYRKQFLSRMDLQILKVDEQGEKGIFDQYVRWLHFNALRQG